MKAKKRTMIIKKLWWECMIEGHRHKSEEKAQACIDERERIAKRKKTVSASMSYEERIKFILDHKQSGMKYADIGKLLGVSGAYVGQMYRFHKWREQRAIEYEREKKYQPWVLKLPTGMRNAIIDRGITDEAAFRAMTDREILAIPGIGPRALIELHRVFGHQI